SLPIFMSALHHVDLHLEQKQDTSQRARCQKHAPKAEKNTCPQTGNTSAFQNRRATGEKKQECFPRPAPNKGQEYLEKGGDSIGRDRPMPDFLTLSSGNNL
ncbi:hypothetical protein, partial [uncultured Mailhella sp.]|uniref:hypothetical protein n=1 Tax=uncultured Mailhella sp. TaxID=1981031 RepID=UPI0025DD3CFC